MEIISVKQMGKRRNEHGDSDCEGEMKKLIVITGKQGVAGAIPAGAHAAFLFSLLSSSFFFLSPRLVYFLLCRSENMISPFYRLS